MMQPPGPDRQSEFVVLPSGELRGDDQADGRLAQALRYVERVLAQTSQLLGIGSLQRFEIEGNPHLSAVVTSRDAHGVTVKTTVSRSSTYRSRVFPPSNFAHATETDLRASLQAFVDVEGSAGGFIINREAQVLAARTPAGLTMEGLSGVGRRLQAAFDSLALYVTVESILLGFERGQVLSARSYSATAALLLTPRADLLMAGHAASLFAARYTELDLSKVTEPVVVTAEEVAPAPPPQTTNPTGTKKRKLGIWA